MKRINEAVRNNPENKSAVYCHNLTLSVCIFTPARNYADDYWTPLKIHLFREKGFSISFTT